MQMEEVAQRIRRLACDLCAGESLGEKGCAASSISALAAKIIGIIVIAIFNLPILFCTMLSMSDSTSLCSLSVVCNVFFLFRRVETLFLAIS